MGSVNLRVLRREIAAQANRSVESRANKVLDRQFEKQKQIFFQQFDSNPVTQSIENGQGQNDGIVNTSKGGNLFSLIGFNQGANPIGDLRKILLSQFKLRGKLRVTLNGDRVVVEKTAELPSLTSVEAETSGKYGVGDWTSKSWIRLVEDGIPWFRSYLFGNFKTPDPSRSSEGIEAKTKDGKLVNVRNESFGAIPYLSKLLKQLRDRVTRT